MGKVNTRFYLNLGSWDPDSDLDLGLASTGIFWPPEKPILGRLRHLQHELFSKKRGRLQRMVQKVNLWDNMKGGFHAASDPTLLAASTKARTLVGSFFPGADSTPLDTSTANGRTWHTASATFCGVSPPARKTGLPNF